MVEPAVLAELLAVVRDENNRAVVVEAAEFQFLYEAPELFVGEEHFSVVETLQMGPFPRIA